MVSALKEQRHEKVDEVRKIGECFIERAGKERGRVRQWSAYSPQGNWWSCLEIEQFTSE